MNRNMKGSVRRPLLAGYLGLLPVLLACAIAGGAASTESPAATQTPALRLEDGAVQVPGDNAEWMPVAGESTFELVGQLESRDPWMVTGNTFATRGTTRIAGGLEVGERVRVKGILLEDNTWLANSIEPADEQTGPTLILIGKVASTDPWVVHGITLNVTPDTVISRGIEPDMIALVEILLLEDGTWEVLSIAPLSRFTEIPGCATVTATVARVEGDEVQFAGWPVLTLHSEVAVENEAGVQTALAAHQKVLVVVCAAEDGQFAITRIIVLQATGQDGSAADGAKVLVCHKPDKKGGHTISIAAAALPAHLAHGDKQGPCP